ncbi:MAG: hypothetical protein IMF06_05425 [Proteobacteria bacterium]|nr:hypothetical protein [Pseudomonadota bacterium]
MKLSIDAGVLRDALATNVTERSTLDYMEHALLVADNNTLRITTTDLEKWWTVELDASVSEPGEATGKVALLRAALNGLDGSVDLLLADNRLSLKCGRRRFNIPTLQVDGFTRLPDGETQPVTTEPAKLREAIKRVAYAMGKNDVRPMLNGLLLDTNYCVAADGHRMAICPAPIDVPDTKEIIIPRDTVAYVLQLLGDAATVRLAMRPGGSRIVALQIHNPDTRTTLHTALIDSRYTNWQQIAIDPDGIDKRHTFSAVDARTALARVMPFCVGRAKVKSVPIGLASKGGHLTLSPPNMPETSDTVPCTTNDEQETIGLEANYLRDVLAPADLGKVTWHTSSPDSITAFTVSGRDDTHYIAPLRL